MESQQHREQRVAVFIDVQNMYYSAKNTYNAKTNFAEILKAVVGLRKLVRAFAYVIKADVGDEQGFFDALEKIGFEVRMKDLQVFMGGAKKGDWDIGIAMDMIKMAPKIDTAVLVSGDGDFRDLLEYIRAMGCRTEVASFGKSTSQKLIEEADSFIDLDKNPKRFLMRKAPRPLQQKPAEKTA
jgi:uncharacterized LabA/DUF88 family protein